MLTELDDRYTDIAVRIDVHDAGGTTMWHPQRDGHLLLDAEPSASTHLADTLADTLSGHSPHVWTITGRSSETHTCSTATATETHPMDVMDTVWRFTTQRKFLIDDGQATTHDFTPAYLVIDSLEDVVATLRHTCRRSLQLLSAIAHRGQLANVHVAAITDLTASHAQQDPWTELAATHRRRACVGR